MKKYYHSLFVIFLLLAQLGCSPKVPEKWKNLGVPNKGLLKIYDNSDQNSFYADYSEKTSEKLLTQITAKLSELGYSEVCDQFDGTVKGFQKENNKYVIKVDDLGGKVGLSFFNEKGEEPLLFGICFKGYQLGEPKRNKL